VSHRLYLALGSNLGDRLVNLQAAQAALLPSVRLLTASPVYETPPWGYLDQPAFLNQVLEAETNLSPEDLLDFLKRLEVELGRQPGARYGPRLIDLDILFYDDLVLQSPRLTIPHPYLHERAFVLVPLADLAPGLYHPVLGQTIGDLLKQVDQTGIYLYQT
jgi:2-amino-4-hydroxy-6-hydroxymethyldihydropteridine diphosphokinase